MTDLQLIARAQAGDDRATDTLVRRYEQHAYRVLYSEGFFMPDGTLEDARQEALVGVVNAIRNYRPDGGASFASFVHLCVRRQLVSQCVKRPNRGKARVLTDALRTATDQDGRALPLTLPDRRALPEEHADARAKLALICSGEGFSRLEHLAMVGRCVGLSYEELDRVANGGTVKAIDNAVQRARLKLKAAA